MRKMLNWLIAALVAVPLACLAAPASTDYAARVAAVLKKTPLIDGHNDLPWEIRDRFHSKVAAIDLNSDTSKIAFDKDGFALMTDIPRLRARRGRRPVLVGVHPGGDARARRGADHARADRHRAADGRALPGRLRDGLHRRRRAPHPQGRQDRLADRHRGRPPDRQLAGGAARDVRAGRALHDAHARAEHRLGRLGHRRACTPRADRLRQRGGARDEPAGHAGRPRAMSRPRPCARRSPLPRRR